MAIMTLTTVSTIVLYCDVDPMEQRIDNSSSLNSTVTLVI